MVPIKLKNDANKIRNIIFIFPSFEKVDLFEVDKNDSSLKGERTFFLQY